MRDSRSFVASVATEDAFGHGTHVAGIVGARLNGAGVIGVAPECELLSARVLEHASSMVHSSHAAAAIDWCVAEGADVICLSISWRNDKPELAAAVERAAESGVFCVCAAGNRDVQHDGVEFPASMPIAISVGSAVIHDTGARVAAHSPTKGRVDLFAPGENVLSTYPQRQYARWSGTSMAAPFVAGAIALLYAHRDAANLPRPTRDQLLQQLRRNGSIAESAGLPRRVINPRHVTDHA